MYRVVASVRGSISPAANLSSRHLSPGSERKDLSAVQEGTSDWTAIKGVVFDMDGTLTIPTLDFVLMHERLNIPMSCDILASVNAMSPSQRAEAMRVIEEMEKEANDVMQLQPGVLELMDYLAEHRIQRAIMTRNTLVGVDVLLHNMREKLQQEKDRFSNISPDNFFSKVRMCKPVCWFISFCLCVLTELGNSCIMEGCHDVWHMYIRGCLCNSEI